ncbi:MAG: ATP-binding protein [Cyanobacteria bacterium P01_D01_bin.156]
MNDGGIDIYIKDEKLLNEVLHAHKKHHEYHNHYIDDFPKDIDSIVENTRIHAKTSVNMANNEWSIFFIPNQKFFANQRTWTSPIVLVAGLGITFLLALYVQQQIEQTQKHKIWAQQLAARHQALETAMVALKASQAQAIQNEKLSSLGKMMAGIAHEINNPVSFIHGNLEHVHNYVDELVSILSYIKTQESDVWNQLKLDHEETDFIIQDLPKAITSMSLGTERITNIILALRNFSRLDEAEKKRADIISGLDSTLMILNHRLKATHNRPAIKVQKNYEQIPMLECYPGQLNQVFMNLMSNAIDALQEAWEEGKWSDTNSHYSSPTLQIVTKQCTNKSSILIEILDNGLGIPETIRSQIFDPFFTTKQVGEGTGLGLSISRQVVVEKHQGDLTVDSKVGEYTAFYIQLPLHLTGDSKKS